MPDLWCSRHPLFPQSRGGYGHADASPMRCLWQVFNRRPLLRVFAGRPGDRCGPRWSRRVVRYKRHSFSRTIRPTCICGCFQRGGEEGATYRLCAGRRVEAQRKAHSAFVGVDWLLGTATRAHGVDTTGLGMSFNISIDTDPQQQEAAPPQMFVVRSFLR